jgi:AcrR family transcriptional regulator
MRLDREEAITAAAYRLLESRGFAGTTMQAIAREAQASMETLYRWYGDKTGLFRALIDRNTALVADALQAAAAERLSALTRLGRIGPVLLDMLLGPRAVALNRAAASDASGQLGLALASGGRDTLLPLLIDTMELARQEGSLCGAPADDLADLWLSLLIGDLQVRRVTGALAPLPAETLARRSEMALTRLLRLHGTEKDRASEG